MDKAELQSQLQKSLAEVDALRRLMEGGPSLWDQLPSDQWDPNWVHADGAYLSLLVLGRKLDLDIGSNPER